MKKLFEALKDDYNEENFTLKECIIYGLIFPASFVAVAILAGLLE